MKTAAHRYRLDIRRLDESFSESPRGVVVVSAGGSGNTDSIPESPSKCRARLQPVSSGLQRTVFLQREFSAA